MKSRLTQISLDDLVSGFTGREGMSNYDETKPIKLYELNRDFVWHIEMQQRLIESILQGYPISPLTTCNGFIVDGGNRTTTLWRFKNNEFKVNISDIEYDYSDISNNRNLSRMWDKCQVPVVEITDANSDQISNIYENLNMAVKLSIGQLLENRKHIPLVDGALSIINRSKNNSQYPYREVTNRVWNSKFGKSKGRTEIAFAFQLLVGTMYGPENFHTSFNRHVEFALKDEKQPNFRKLGSMLEMLDEVDPNNTIPRAKKSICFRKFAGAIVYDMYKMASVDYKKKWQTFFKDAYTELNNKQLKDLCDTKTSRANNDLRLKALSENVQSFLNGTFEFTFTEESLVDSDDEPYE
jgi:hypothetical protein